MRYLLVCLMGIVLNVSVLAKDPNCKVNVNTASADQIQACLIGFGAKKAQQIVDKRSAGFKYQHLSDLKGVNGVGDKVLDRVKNNVCFDDQCTGGSHSQAPQAPQPPQAPQTQQPEAKAKPK